MVKDADPSTVDIIERSEISTLNTLFGINSAPNTYNDYQNTIYEGDGDIPYDSVTLADGNKDTWLSQNGLKSDNDKNYSLTMDQIIQQYWNTDSKGYYSPSIKDIYKGQIRNHSGEEVSLENFPAESLEDYVMRRMSSRYFPESGDELIFLGGLIYSMAGTKLLLDEDFLDWIQLRLASEMMNQIYFSMYISSIRSLTANLGYTATGGNDAIQTSTSLTSDIGSHYFTVHTTLGTWESLQLLINERRFAKYKELDKIILEGIIAVSAALLSAVTGGAAANLAKTATSALGTMMKVSMRVMSSVALKISEFCSQITDIIYNAVDASEENKVMQLGDVDAGEEEEATDPDEDHADDNDSPAQKLKKIYDENGVRWVRRASKQPEIHRRVFHQRMLTRQRKSK